MQRIKFKIEYKPLSDESVNRHKNFDALLGLYAATPKLNFFQKLFQNKWIMFTTGIITGGLIATLFVYQTMGDHSTASFNTQNTTDTNQSITTNNSNTIDQPEIKQHTQSVEQSNTESLLSNQTIAQNNSENTSVDKSVTTKNSITDNAGSNNNNYTLNEENNTGFSEHNPAIGDVNPTGDNSNSVDEKNMAGNNAHFSNQQDANEQALSFAPHGTITESVVMQEIKSAPERIKPDQSQSTKSAPEKNNSENLASNENNVAKNEKDKTKTTNKENNDGSGTANEKAGADNANKIIDHIFSNKIFTKDTTSSGGQANADSIKMDHQLKLFSEPDSFIDRYAQVSFISPIGSNGLDSYKYYNHFSLNIIQGYNGAVQGVEVGSVLNLDKGYVKGGQFAGVGNLIAGNLQGIQGAGVINMSRKVTGTQYAGVINFSANGMTGMQGAGVANFTSGKVNGMQAAGVLNISGGINDTSVIFQASGVSNISLSKKSSGLQVAGVINIANQHTGSQIGLVNVAKNIQGFQIGLVNIADTINGASIGLLSISKNGIFDVDVFNSDLFQANIALRVGSPSIYNIFAFGISPFSDTLRYGYGLGIGGHIAATQKISVDIDAMAWSTFQDQFDFTYDYVRLMNQLRVLPAYSFNKNISIFAGPELNVEIYDNDVEPFHTNTISHYTGTNVTTAISMGYVVGLRFF